MVLAKKKGIKMEIKLTKEENEYLQNLLIRYELDVPDNFKTSLQYKIGKSIYDRLSGQEKPARKKDETKS